MNQNAERYSMTLKEASEWSGIGINRLRDITNEPKCPFVFFIGVKRMIRTERFRKWLDAQYSI